jgi:hypothetical protein
VRRCNAVLLSKRILMRLTLLLVSLLFLTAQAQTGEVERAYRAIPHRYTHFSPEKAKMKPAEKVYLEANFRLVNEAIVTKVAALQSKNFSRYSLQISSILGQLERQKAPPNLVKYHSLVTGAIKDQQSYFAAWAKTPSAAFNAGDPKVQAASAKLRQAYSILQSQFPSQAKQVQEAFFDHLCALDFI